MKRKLLVVDLVAVAIVVSMLSFADSAAAQSFGRKGASVIPRCYANNGKSVRCDRLDAVNKKIQEKKGQAK